MAFRCPLLLLCLIVDELKRAVDQLGLSQAILKFQIHAGGRGKAGGVKFAKSHEEIIEAGKKIIGM